MTASERPPVASSDAILHNPLGLLAELTHRCPLGCPYCSNPLALDRGDTSSIPQRGRGCSRSRRAGCAAGPSFRRRAGRAARPAGTDGRRASRRPLHQSHHLGGRHYRGDAAKARRRPVSTMCKSRSRTARPPAPTTSPAMPARSRASGRSPPKSVRLKIPLTVNAVMHRANIDRVRRDGRACACARRQPGRDRACAILWLGAEEPRGADAERRAGRARRRRGRGVAVKRHHGEIVIDAVVPDYYARLPKPCVGGWGRRSLNVTPPARCCPAMPPSSIPGLEFWSVREHSLADIWANSPAFNAFRGTDWMTEPCRSCARRDIDFGGCRCQAFALTGDARATDPVCHLAPEHGRSPRLPPFSATSPTTIGECRTGDRRSRICAFASRLASQLSLPRDADVTGAGMECDDGTLRQRKILRRRRRARYAAPVGAARHDRAHRHEIWLRHRPMRRLHRAYRGRRHALVPGSGRHGGQPST